MKICHVISGNTFAGIEQYVAELSQSLESKHEVSLICNEEIASNFKHCKVIPIKKRSRRSFLAIYTIYKILRSNDFDIVNTHGSNPTYIVSILKKMMNINFVATIHGIKSNVNVFNKADLVIGGERSLVDINTRTRIIHNWYNYSSDSKAEGSQAIAVGRLEDVKGFDLLIKAWVNIATPLVIIGSGPQKDFLNNLINTLNLSKSVSIKEWIDQDKLMQEYAKAKVMIISSRREGGPRVGLEALANNLPVLSTDVGHMNKILPSELLAKPNDLDSLKLLLENTVDNIDLLNQSAIFEFVKEEFSLESQKNKTISAYEDCLRSSS